jgi:hypothetical protein
MQVIFSCEDSTYMWWQAELLHYTHLQSGMQGQLTALVAATGEKAEIFTCNTIRVANYKDRAPHEPLPCLNKPGGIADWAVLDGPRDETVLIVDPDSVFLRPVSDPGPIPDGEAYSEEHDYMAVELPENSTVLDRHCNWKYRSRVQPVGIYILINRASVANLAPLWLQKSIEIASDPVCREALAGTGWLSDMWGYCIASAELGISHRIRRFSQVTGSHCLKHPIIHYCFPIMAAKDRMWAPDTQEPILWSKWDYVPWSRLPDPNGATPEGQVVLQRLQELVVVKSFQLRRLDAAIKCDNT